MVALNSPTLRNAKLAARGPSDIAKHIERAIERFEEGHYADSLAEWDQILSEERGNASAYLGRSLILLQLRDFQHALESLEVASSLDGVSDIEQNLHHARAVALYGLGRTREAVKEFDKALTVGHSPEIADLRRALVEERLLELVKEGFLLWSGKRPQGSKNPVRISPGPPVSDYVIQDRR